jgi:Ca2+-binding RTX toxin-like protein
MRRLAVLSAVVVLVVGITLAVVSRGEGRAVAGDAKCQGKTATIVGSADHDELRGTLGRDIVQAKGGSDDIEALGGRDLLCGGPGNDDLEGDRGDDHLYGGTGRDELEGGLGNETCAGGEELEGCERRS